MVAVVNNEDDPGKRKMRMSFFFFLGGGMGLVFKVFFGCRGCSTMAERGSNRLGKVCEGCRWFNLSNKEGSKCAWQDL